MMANALAVSPAEPWHETETTARLFCVSARLQACLYNKVARRELRYHLAAYISSVFSGTW